MIFGGTTDSEYEVFAETTLGKHVVDYFTVKQCIDFIALVLIFTQLTVLISTTKL